MATPASRSASKKSAGAPSDSGGRKTNKILVTKASASEIRAALGITPAEMKVAAKAIAAAKKPTVARVTAAQKTKAARRSAVKRANAR